MDKMQVFKKIIGYIGSILLLLMMWSFNEGDLEKQKLAINAYVVFLVLIFIFVIVQYLLKKKLFFKKEKFNLESALKKEFKQEAVNFLEVLIALINLRYSFMQKQMPLKVLFFTIALALIAHVIMKKKKLLV